MRKPSLYLMLLSLHFFSLSSVLAEDLSVSTKAQPVQPADSENTHAFVPFTGKISKTKVRMRTQPTYDAQIVREVIPGELVVVLGETEDFYAIQPPTEFKAYIYRTFVLDDIVEGKNVNVRLNPDLESAIVAQLNSGDRVQGTIDPYSPKWLAIDMPATARFYIAKEFV